MTDTPDQQANDLVEYDLVLYSGNISRTGYELLCEELKKQSCSKALLVLTTLGGDPHAGFRIARALQHHYEDGFYALIPWVCKSAGTLICIGAKRLYLDNQSELGPLDVQVKKQDEVVGRNSGLDILQAVNYLQNQAMAAFNTYLEDLTREDGPALSTKVASDIASKLTTGLFSPIFAQIEPMRLAEMQRATDIAFAYGTRLNEKSTNLRRDGLGQLVTQYPSHSFVIDRKEAGKIFTDVRKPDGVLLGLSTALLGMTKPLVNADSPRVLLLPNFQKKGGSDENLSDASAGAPSDAASQQSGGEAANEAEPPIDPPGGDSPPPQGQQAA